MLQGQEPMGSSVRASWDPVPGQSGAALGGARWLPGQSWATDSRRDQVLGQSGASWGGSGLHPASSDSGSRWDPARIQSGVTLDWRGGSGFHPVGSRAGRGRDPVFSQSGGVLGRAGPIRSQAGLGQDPVFSQSGVILGRPGANQEPGRVGGGIERRANQEWRWVGEGSSVEPIRRGSGLGRDTGQSQSGVTLAWGGIYHGANQERVWVSAGGEPSEPIRSDCELGGIRCPSNRKRRRPPGEGGSSPQTPKIARFPPRSSWQ